MEIRKYLPRFREKAVINEDQWRGNSWSLDTGVAIGFLSSQFSSYLAIYRNSLAVRSVVSFRANAAATVPVKVYRKLDKDVREALADHGLQRTLEDPNPEDVQFSLIRDMLTDTDLFDVTYWLKVRVGSKLLLIRQYPDAVRHIGDPMYPDGFDVLQRDGETKHYKRDQMFWMHGYGSSKGVSPMEALKRELEIDKSESDFRERQSRLGWRNTGVITRPRSAPAWNETSRRRFIEEMTSRYSGEGTFSGRPLLLEEDMQWQSDKGQGDASTTYVDARNFTIKMVLLAFHMAPQMMGLEGAGFNSLVEYKNQMFQINLKPFYKFTEQNFEKQLLPEFVDTKGVYVEFLINAMLEGDPALQAQIAAVALGGNPYMSVDEWRSEVLNKPPIPASELPTPVGAANNPVGNQFAFGTGTPAIPATATPQPSSATEPPAFSFASLGEGMAAIRSKYIDIFNMKDMGERTDRGALFLFLQAYVNELSGVIGQFVPGQFMRGKTVAYIMKQSELISKQDNISSHEITDRMMSWTVREYLNQNDRGPQ